MEDEYEARTRADLDSDLYRIWLDHSPSQILQSLADRFSAHQAQMAGSDYSELELCALCGIGDALGGLAKFSSRWFD